MDLNSKYPPEVYEVLGNLEDGKGITKYPDWELWIAYCRKEELVECVPDLNGVLFDITDLGRLALKLRKTESGEPLAAITMPEAIWLGKGKLRLGNETLSLEPQFAEVLQALVELGAATKPELQKHSGRDEPDRLLKKLVRRFPGLQSYITFPGGRGKGGYRTTIKDGSRLQK